MKLRLFVIGFSAVLMAWLSATYFLETPLENYPRFGRGSAPIFSSRGETPKPLDLADPAEKPEVVSK
jgi:hypothetical protein